MDRILDAAYWDKRYETQETGWDIGEVSAPLKAYIDQLEDKDISVLIPGCGNAWEAEYMLSKGFTNITLVDFSEHAVTSVKQRLSAYVGKGLTVLCQDFFDLHQLFDLILEQTFFCALVPELRRYYADKLFNNLQAGGKVAGVLFNHEFEVNPPFGTTKDVYLDLFEPLFDVEVLDECYNSIASRNGSELFLIMKRRSS